MTVPALDPFVEIIRNMRMSQLFRDEVGWLWPLCESLHFLGLCLLIGAAGFFDLRLLGFMKGVPLRSAKRSTSPVSISPGSCTPWVSYFRKRSSVP